MYWLTCHPFQLLDTNEQNYETAKRRSSAVALCAVFCRNNLFYFLANGDVLRPGTRECVLKMEISYIRGKYNRRIKGL